MDAGPVFRGRVHHVPGRATPHQTFYDRDGNLIGCINGGVALLELSRDKFEHDEMQGIIGDLIQVYGSEDPRLPMNGNSWSHVVGSDAPIPCTQVLNMPCIASEAYECMKSVFNTL